MNNSPFLDELHDLLKKYPEIMLISLIEEAPGRCTFLAKGDLNQISFDNMITMCKEGRERYPRGPRRPPPLRSV